jgi:hypothetical protein
VREENLEPAPRSWVEKAYELGSLHVLSAALILLSAFHPLSAILGQGPALAILIPATTALTRLISLPDEPKPTESRFRRLFWAAAAPASGCEVGQRGHSREEKHGGK